jgi:hypothetical protein
LDISESASGWRPNQLVVAALCTLPLAGLTGCGGGTAGGSSPAVVSDSAGIRLVVNTGRGWREEDAWRLESVLQVGELDGPPAFGRIAAVTPRSEGGVYVLDAQSGLVSSFDESGAPVAQFGGEGDGPGEFRNPNYVTEMADGRLAVAESFPPRLHWFSADRQFERMTRLEDGAVENGTRAAAVFAIWSVTDAGEPYAQISVFPMTGAKETLNYVLRFSADPASQAPPDTVTRWTTDFELRLADSEVPMFEPRHTWVLGRDGALYLSPGSPYEIRVFTGAGILSRIVRRRVPAVPVTDEVKDIALAELRKSMERGGAPAEMVDRFVANAAFEDVLPSVQRVWVSEPDGRLWVGVYDGARFLGVDRPGAWDIFAPDGTYLGRLPVPEGFRLTAVTTDAVYGVWENELKVPFARQYRVVRPVAIKAG